MSDYKRLIIDGPPTGRYVLITNLIDILEARAILLQEQGMDQSVGVEAISLLRGAHSEIKSILKRLTQHEHP
jgi:hypothetical protein